MGIATFLIAFVPRKIRSAFGGGIILTMSARD